MTMPKIVTIDEKTLAGNPWLTKYIGDARQVQVPEMVTDADGGAVLDVEHGVAGDRRFDEPAENQAGVLLRGGQAPNAVDRAVLAGALGRHELRRSARLGHE